MKGQKDEFNVRQEVNGMDEKLKGILCAIQCGYLDPGLATMLGFSLLRAILAPAADFPCLTDTAIDVLSVLFHKGNQREMQQEDVADYFKILPPNLCT
jgi:hypothetical protein